MPIVRRRSQKAWDGNSRINCCGVFFFSSRRRHTRFDCDWSSDVCSSDLLVLSPNKTLAAQLCAEFRRLLPDNAVEYFVSYYDYYQPEAYIARTDTYIEKDSSRNDDIDRMRHATTQDLLTRRDVLVVASVSCIYGIGSGEDYMGESLKIEKGQAIPREVFLRKLTQMLYERNHYDLSRLRFRVRGDRSEDHTSELQSQSNLLCP